MTIDPALVGKFLAGASSINWTAALAELRSGQPMEELMVVEDIADVAASLGVPYAAWVGDAIEVLEFIEEARVQGYWTPAEPTDPAMIHAADPNKHGGR